MSPTFRAVAVMIAMACGGLSTSYATAQSPMNFELRGNGGNCYSCEWIAADGLITVDTPQAFQNFLQANPALAGVSEVMLNSSGGNLDAGLMLGRLFRTNKMKTSVGRSIPYDDVSRPNSPHMRAKGQCASACAWAFLGGVSRSATEGEIGVHQFYYPFSLAAPNVKFFDAKNLSDEQRQTAFLIDYAVGMGVDPRFVATSAKIAPESIYFLNQQDLESYGVYWQPEEFTAWGIEAYGKGVVAFSKSRDKTRTAIVFCGNNGRPRFQIKAPAISSEADYQDALSNVEYATVLGMTVGRDAISLSVQNGVLSLTINMENFNLRNLAVLDSAGLTVETANVFASYFRYRLTSLNSEPNIRIALRNCI